MEIKELRAALINSCTTLKNSEGCYQLHNNSVVCGLGYGDALAEFVGHLAEFLKLDIRYEKVSDLVDSKEDIHFIEFDKNAINDKIGSKTIISIKRTDSVADDFMIALYKLTEAVLRLTNDENKIDEIRNYLDSYNESELEKIADEAEKAVAELEAEEIDYVGEGFEKTLIDFSRIFNQKEYGVFSSFENSEDYHHINVFLRNPETLYTPMIVNSNAPSVVRLMETLVVNDAIERKMVVVSDVDNLNTVSRIISVKTAKQPYIASLVEGYIYLYLTALMSRKIAA